MKKIKDIFLGSLILFVISFPSNAFVIRNGVWRLSEIVTNNTLYSKLFDIEDEAGKGNFERVETLIRDIRNSGAFTNYYTNEGEPLLLTLDSASLWYRCEAAQNKNKLILNEVKTKLEEWADKAKGKKWKCYKYLFHRLRAYYVANKCNKERIDIQKDMIYYDTSDETQIDSLIEYFKKFPDCIGDLDAFVTEFKKNGGVVTPSLQLFIINNSKSSNKQKLDDVILWLYNNRNSKLETIQDGVNVAMQLATNKDKSSIDDLYDILTDLAIWQPGNEERMPVIAFLLNERAKLKAILDRQL